MGTRARVFVCAVPVCVGVCACMRERQRERERENELDGHIINMVSPERERERERENERQRERERGQPNQLEIEKYQGRREEGDGRPLERDAGGNGSLCHTHRKKAREISVIFLRLTQSLFCKWLCLTHPLPSSFQLTLSPSSFLSSLLLSITFLHPPLSLLSRPHLGSASHFSHKLYSSQ